MAKEATVMGLVLVAPASIVESVRNPEFDGVRYAIW
jgi:hypothetical protein